MKGILLAGLGLVALTLAGCGGGGGGSSTSYAYPAGVWAGTTDNGKDAGVIVLPSGKIFSVYSDTGGLAGAIIGNIHMTDPSSFSFSAKDYGVDDSVDTASVVGTFREQQDMAVTITETGGSLTASLLYQDLPPITFTDMAGTYEGDDGTVGVKTIITGGGGVTTLANDGCTTVGRLTSAGINSVFSVSLTYGTACGDYSGKGIQGIVVYDADNSSFYAAATNSSLTAGGILWGQLAPPT
nr:hypothetical protein MERC5_00040 [uncultured bacterium]